MLSLMEIYTLQIKVLQDLARETRQKLSSMPSYMGQVTKRTDTKILDEDEDEDEMAEKDEKGNDVVTMYQVPKKEEEEKEEEGQRRSRLS